MIFFKLSETEFLRCIIISSISSLDRLLKNLKLISQYENDKYVINTRVVISGFGGGSGGAHGGIGGQRGRHAVQRERELRPERVRHGGRQLAQRARVRHRPLQPGHVHHDTRLRFYTNIFIFIWPEFTSSEEKKKRKKDYFSHSFCRTSCIKMTRTFRLGVN